MCKMPSSIMMSAIVVGLIGGLPSRGVGAARVTDEQMVVTGNTRFALELYGKLKDKQGNLFLSPYSISTALALAYAGARGNTASGMARTLYLELAPERFHPALARLINEMNEIGKQKECNLTVANAMWGQKGYEFRQAFLDLTNRHYGAGLNQVDFAKPEEARSTINAWVEKHTQDKIRDLIKPGVLDGSTRLVLTNAIYFKGKWAAQFKPDRTLKEPFTLNNGEKVSVSLMHQTAKVMYMENDAFQALELAYGSGRLVMTVFLPKNLDGLEAFERTLTAENLTKWLHGLGNGNVIVALPKLTMTTEFSLASELKSLGMADAFTSGAADFSGMNGKKDLFISSVLHKAFIDVNEEGTEAAAATAVVGRSVLEPPPTPVFRADHPFVFMIRDVQSGSILFVGRVANPRGD